MRSTLFIIIFFALGSCATERPDSTTPNDEVRRAGSRPQAQRARDRPEERSYPAICNVSVEGGDTYDVEGEDGYLAQVIACENGSADMEALRALAVTARTYMYFQLATRNSISDSQTDQVVSCQRPPSSVHNEAVRSTRGQIIVHNDEPICAFYVAGAEPSGESCVPVRAGRDVDRDRHNTEWAVTYNACKVGDRVRPSGLGSYVNPHNRGALSQLGSHCLSTRGSSYPQILRFYYGDDIQLVRTFGSCTSSSVNGQCGNKICELDESCERCPHDCGFCRSGCLHERPRPVVMGLCSDLDGICVEPAECPALTHTTVRGQCPGTSSNIRCCVHHETAEAWSEQWEGLRAANE